MIVFHFVINRLANIKKIPEITSQNQQKTEKINSAPKNT